MRTCLRRFWIPCSSFSSNLNVICHTTFVKAFVSGCKSFHIRAPSVSCLILQKKSFRFFVLFWGDGESHISTMILELSSVSTVCIQAPLFSFVPFWYTADGIPARTSSHPCVLHVISAEKFLRFWYPKAPNYLTKNITVRNFWSALITCGLSSASHCPWWKENWSSSNLINILMGANVRFEFINCLHFRITNLGQNELPGIHHSSEKQEFKNQPRVF